MPVHPGGPPLISPELVNRTRARQARDAFVQTEPGPLGSRGLGNPAFNDMLAALMQQLMQRRGFGDLALRRGDPGFDGPAQLTLIAPRLAEYTGDGKKHLQLLRALEQFGLRLPAPLQLITDLAIEPGLFQNRA